jgi:hypothetical protein
MERFFGGRPAAVILQLAIASIIIGAVLHFFDYNLDNLYQAVVRFWQWLGVDVIKKVGEFLALGALVVVPIWLFSRLISYLNPRRSK